MTQPATARKLESAQQSQQRNKERDELRAALNIAQSQVLAAASFYNNGKRLDGSPTDLLGQARDAAICAADTLRLGFRAYSRSDEFQAYEDWDEDYAANGGDLNAAPQIAFNMPRIAALTELIAKAVDECGVIPRGARSELGNALRAYAVSDVIVLRHRDCRS